MFYREDKMQYTQETFVLASPRECASVGSRLYLSEDVRENRRQKVSQSAQFAASCGQA